MLPRGLSGPSRLPHCGFLLLTLSLLFFLVHFPLDVRARSLSVEMRFKKADEAEKAERLKRLHEHQLHQIEAEQEDEAQAEQVAQLISNRAGKTGSFPGDVTSKSSLITAPLSFGGQIFDVTLDTGSTVLWVTSASCTATACKAHKQYDQNRSQTFKYVNPRLNFEIEYGSGSIQGALATETVGLGELSVSNQLFGLVTLQEGSTFEHAQWIGLLGLAYPSLAAFEHIDPNSSKPFFDSIMAAGLLNQNAFSFWLVRSALTPPMFFMGAPPPEYYIGTLDFFDVVDPYYWTLKLVDILVDGRSLDLCPPPNHCKVVVDSGTSYMSAPTNDLPDILRALSHGHPDAACMNQTSQVITYVMDGNKTLTLEPDFFFTRSYTGEYCKVKYIGLDVDAPRGPLHIFGDVLFRKYFVHFDRDRNQVGFAIAREVAEPKPTLRSLIMQKLYNMI